MFAIMNKPLLFVTNRKNSINCMRKETPLDQ